MERSRKVIWAASAALIGIAIAFAGISAGDALARPALDGVASIGIGVLLATVAPFLGRETKGLLLGEPADSDIVSSICAIAHAQPGIQRSNGLFTTQAGPSQIVAGISVDFADTCPPARWSASRPPSRPARGRSIPTSSPS